MIKIDYMNTSSQWTAHDQENQRLLRDSRKEMEFLIEKLLILYPSQRAALYSSIFLNEFALESQIKFFKSH